GGGAAAFGLAGTAASGARSSVAASAATAVGDTAMATSLIPNASAMALLIRGGAAGAPLCRSILRAGTRRLRSSGKSIPGFHSTPSSDASQVSVSWPRSRSSATTVYGPHTRPCSVRTQYFRSTPRVYHRRDSVDRRTAPTHAHPKSATAERDAPLPPDRCGHGEEGAGAVARPARPHPLRRRRGAPRIARHHQAARLRQGLAEGNARALLHHAAAQVLPRQHAGAAGRDPAARALAHLRRLRRQAAPGPPSLRAPRREVPLAPAAPGAPLPRRRGPPPALRPRAPRRGDRAAMARAAHRQVEPQPVYREAPLL